MTKNHIREVGNMALRFPKLTTLNLGYNGVVSLNMEFLPKSLSTLELQHNNIMEIRGAKSLENLITLKLEYNNLETPDVSDVIKLPKLSSLTLAENHIDDTIVKLWNEKTKKASGITE